MKSSNFSTAFRYLNKTAIFVLLAVVASLSLNLLPQTASAETLSDLTPTGLTAPSTAGTGQAITVALTVNNQGAGNAGTHYNRYYLSADQSLGGDIDLGSYYAPNVVAGSSYTQTLNLYLPLNTVGTFYLIAVVDAGSSLIEADDTNNTSSSTQVTLTPPDLTPTALIAPSTAGTGQTITVALTVDNGGTGNAGTHYNRYYLSTDQSLGGDIDLGGYYAPNVAAGASYTQTLNLYLPLNTVGDLYLIAVVDAGGSLTESDESNNISMDKQITLTPPDLKPASLATPSTAGTGQIVAVSLTVLNQGTGNAGTHYNRYYLSADQSLGGDIDLGGYYAPNVIAGASYTQTLNLYLPLNTVGDFYLISVVDAGGSLIESDESNNVLAGDRITLTPPDLTPTGLIAPATSGTGQTITTSLTVLNQGTGNAGTHYNRYYLSADQSLGGDIDLGGYYAPNVAAGSSYTQTLNLYLPLNTVGTFYLIAVVDAGSSLIEADDANNILASTQITLTPPDLTPATLTTPATAVAGQAVGISLTVDNQGTGNAGTHYNRYYLSADQSLGGDIDLGGYYAPNVAAGASYTQTLNLYIPQNLAGTFHLIAVVDAGSSLIESNESNNILSSGQIGIGNRPPTANAGGPYTVSEGSSVVLAGSGSDPDSDPLTYAWDLDNNGSFETSGQTPTFSAAGRDGPSSQTITLRVSDNKGAYATSSSTVSILNESPAVGAITAPVDPVSVNTTINVSGSFTDPGVLDTHSATWDWGDGTASPAAVSETAGSGSVSGSHTYTAAGVYTLTLMVTDKDGALGQSVFQYVVAYDASGGFVTGSGMIDSPSGAYAPDTSLAGRAIFGFVAKYQAGATTPEGHTQFRFVVARMAFASTSYDWLVVSGPKAQFKGSGTINGGGEYGFLLTATDGQVAGGGGVDKFRIKIWDKVTGDIIYDNQMGAEDTADPTTAIVGGSVVIQRQ